MWDEDKDIHHGDASGLLSYFVSNNDERFIYRGVGRHEWQLSPSISRAPSSADFRSDHREEYKALKEISYLSRFINACDDAGLQVSGDSYELRGFLMEPRGDNSSGRAVDIFQFPSLWPTDKDDVFRFLAQAQHHGVPTRLLDWTSSPLVACYFAVSQAINYWVAMNNIGYNLDLKAWKICIVELDTIYASAFKDVFRVRKAPGSTSKNLAAQKGLFTFIKGFGLEGLDLVNHPFSRSYLRRHMLPISEARSLLRMIEKFGVSIATLFPGYDSAGKHSVEGMLLEDLHNTIMSDGI